MPEADLPTHETERLRLLDELALLDSGPEAAFDALARTAAYATGCPIALITLVDGRRQWFKSRVGLAISETSRSDSICAHALVDEALLEVPDLAADPRFADNPLVTGEPRARFYAAKPVMYRGLALGTICVIDKVPRRLYERERRVLDDLALSVSEAIENRERLRRLAASERRLADFAAASGDWLWETDAEHRVVWLSRQFEAITGQPPEVQLGKRPPDEPLFDAFGRVVEGGRTMIDLLGRERPFVRAVLRDPRADGVHFVSLSGVPVRSAGGRFAGFRGTARDVSDRIAAQQQERELLAQARRAAEQWRLAARSAGLGIFEFSAVEAMIWLDAAACALHGLIDAPGRDADADRGARIALVDWVACLEPASREAAQRFAARAAGATEPLREVLGCGVAGESRQIEFVARALVAEPGRAQAVIGVCRDVSEQQGLARLRQDAQDAQRASRSKSEFLSRVSHELRTPLNGILGFAQLLESDTRDPLSATQRQRVQTMRLSGNRLLSLINDVLELSKIEQGRFSLAVAPLSMLAHVEAGIGLLRPAADDKGVAIVLDADPATAQVRADPRGLDQIVLNLLSNAIKYNREGGRVRVMLGNPRRGSVQLSVEDTGCGMSAEQLANLFQPFNRLGAERTGVEGTGLGLVIARELAIAMGGSLDASSTPGQGACFVLTLPAAPARPTADDAARDDAPASTQSDWIDQLGATAVYIEDDPVNTVLMQQVFERLGGWRLLHAATGSAGLALAQSEQPVLVLTDMNLPDMSGLEIITALRSDARTRHSKVIAVSADAMPEQISAARDRGADDYWTKPLDLRKLNQRLKEMTAG